MRRDPPRQNENLRQAEAGLVERDLRVVRLQPDAPITIDGAAVEFPEAAKIYRYFGIDDDQFAVLLIGKDGGVKMQADQPPPIETVFDLIDSMPMRQLEMQQQRNAAN